MAESGNGEEAPNDERRRMLGHILTMPQNLDLIKRTLEADLDISNSDSVATRALLVTIVDLEEAPQAGTQQEPKPEE